MKQLLSILLLNGLWLPTLACAEVPNYDTSSGIVSFPQVSVNDKDKYINTDLLLNPSGTWKILAYTPEPLFNLTGEWTGTIYGFYNPDWSPTVPCAPISTQISLTQSDGELTGKVKLFGKSCSFPSGLLTGKVIGNEVTFTVETPDYGKTSFSGHLTDDNGLLVGVGNYKPTASQGNWVLFLNK